MLDTLTFDPGRPGQEPGWVSRYQFYPDWMQEMANNLYSFKGGELFVHDSDNVPRGEFYGVKYGAEVTTVLNESPIEKKVFKTIQQVGDTPWNAEYYSELNSGLIEADSFVVKESDWFAYIRREDGNAIDAEDAVAPSTQGVGIVSVYAANVISFSTSIDTNAFAVGDRVYVLNGSDLDYIGDVADYTVNTIEVTGAAVVPIVGDFILVAKNRIAESYGIRGGYMTVKLSVDSEDSVELFAVGSSTLKSYP